MFYIFNELSLWVPGKMYDHVSVIATHAGHDDALTGLRGRGTEALSVPSNPPCVNTCGMSPRPTNDRKNHCLKVD